MNTGRRIQLDRDFGESGEDPDVCAGADGRGKVLEPHPPPLPPPPALFLHQTCHYQRKDSPVEALTLSPEPLGGDEEGRNGAGKGKQGGNKGNMKGRK